MDGEGGRVQEQRVRELEENVRDKFHIVGRAKQRAEWFKYQDQQKAQKEAEEQQEKFSYAQIDWHDFVVVETVLFTEADDQAVLPAPTQLNDLQFASLEQKGQTSLNNMRIEEAFPSEEDSQYDHYPAHSQPQPQSQAQQMPPPQYFTPPVAPQAVAPTIRTRSGEEEEEEEEAANIRERTEARERAQAAQAQAKGVAAPMKIKENYVPRAAARNASRAQMAVCPNCKQQIPYSELDEHMRSKSQSP